MPRAAGFAFAFAASLGAFGDGWQGASLVELTWMISGMGIAVLGFVDDGFSLSAGTRLAIQCILVCLFLGVQASHWTIPPFFALLLCGLLLFGILGVINFYNFADGINGHIGLQGLGLLVAWAIFASVTSFGLISLSPLMIVTLSLSLIIFLWANLARKSVFMGDSGSTYIGYLAGTLPVLLLSGQNLRLESYAQVFAGFLVFSFVVIMDCVTVLLAKKLSGLSLSMPHRHHIYQRLSRRPGWGHERTSFFLFGLQALLSLTYILGFSAAGYRPSFFIISIILCAAYTFCCFVTNFGAIRALAREMG